MRVLTPEEYDLLRGAIPKLDHMIMLDTLFYTGLRYTEFQELQRHRDWFDGRVLRIPSRGRGSRTSPPRTVYLSDYARKTLPLFFKLKRKVPDRAVFDRNLKRWSATAEISPEGLSVKTLRKTWVAYLILSYPEHIDLIAQSLGISTFEELSALKSATAELRDYKDEIRRRTAGWLPE